MQYIIKHKKENLYIHFNPNNEDYYLQNTSVGACVFDKYNGNGLISQFGKNSINLHLIKISDNNVKKIESEDHEKEIYSKLHSETEK